MSKKKECKTDKHHVHHPKRKKEQLSEYELLELMGVHRDKYKRVNRRVKRR